VIRISVSQTAKLVGLTRKQVQCDIHKGILQTHEGLVTMDSLYRAYPNCCLDTDSSKTIARLNDIKDNAFFNKNKSEAIRSANEDALLVIVKRLNNRLREAEREVNYWKSLYEGSINCKNIK
jgi:hypothetical protein